MKTLRTKITILGTVITTPVIKTAVAYTEGRFIIQTKQYIQPTNKKLIRVNHEIIVYGKLTDRIIERVEKGMSLLVEGRFATIIDSKGVPETIIEGTEFLIIPHKKKKK